MPWEKDEEALVGASIHLQREAEGGLGCGTGQEGSPKPLRHFLDKLGTPRPPCRLFLGPRDK